MVDYEIYSGVPKGGIIMWSGTIATIPDGWLLCNGSNGTPDLRDKFIVGANQDSGGVAKTNVTGSLLQTGGSNQHNHNINLGDNNSNVSIYTQDVAVVNAASYTTYDTVTVPPFYALAFIQKK